MLPPHNISWVNTVYFSLHCNYLTAFNLNSNLQYYRFSYPAVYEIVRISSTFTDCNIKVMHTHECFFAFGILMLTLCTTLKRSFLHCGISTFATGSRYLEKMFTFLLFFVCHANRNRSYNPHIFVINSQVCRESCLFLLLFVFVLLLAPMCSFGSFPSLRQAVILLIQYSTFYRLPLYLCFHPTQPAFLSFPSIPSSTLLQHMTHFCFSFQLAEAAEQLILMPSITVFS